MPQAKVILKNPVDVTDWTREEIVADLERAFSEASEESHSGKIMTLEEAYADFRKRSATYNV